MIKKTLYFGNPAYLSLKDGQLVIKLPEVECNNSIPDDFKIRSTISKPIEDIGILVLDNRRITVTSGLLDALLENNVTVITCDVRGMPVGLMLPLSGNTVQSERFREQINASVPLKKQLWQQTVKQKIINQSIVLRNCLGDNFKCMEKWADDVRSGDSENMEARAAAFYWKKLFSHIKDFTRDREGICPNNLLNYGYAVLRAVIARALVSSGLLPTFGIHHHNRYNAYCLADDIMEPYRPYVDELVYNITERHGIDIELTRDIKAELLTIPTIEVIVSGKRNPLMIAASLTTASLYRCFCGELRKIAYPEK